MTIATIASRISAAGMERSLRLIPVLQEGISSFAYRMQVTSSSSTYLMIAVSFSQAPSSPDLPPNERGADTGVPEV